MVNLDRIRLVAPYRVSGIKSASLEEAWKYLNKKKLIALDCETRKKKGFVQNEKSGLDPYMSDVVMVQVGDLKRQYVIDTRFVSISLLKPILESKTIVGTNLKFDFKQLAHNFGIQFSSVYDIRLVEQVLTLNQEGTDTKGFYSLADMATRYLGAEFSPVVVNKTKGKVLQEQLSLFPELSFSKATRLEFLRIEDKTPFTRQQIIYGAADVWMPLLIRKKQRKLLTKDNLHVCAQLENDFVPVLASMELKGLFLDESKWLSNIEKYEDKLLAVEEKLQEIHPINWNSQKQVVSVFKQMGVPTEIIDKAKSIGGEKVFKDSIGALHIKKFESKYPVVKDYLEYKQLKKLATSYGVKFLGHIHPVTGRVHSDYYQILNTARLSSNEPNLQNVPSEEKREGFRKCFTPQREKTFVVADYDSQEKRILAVFADEKVMIDFFLNGDKDMHSLTARRMYNVPVSKKENTHLRQIGKITGFTMDYGGGASKIADAFQIPIKEAENIEKMYKAAYPELPPYFAKWHQFVTKNGYILHDSYTKRRTYIYEHREFKELEHFINKFKASGWANSIPKKVWSRYFILKGMMERDSQNYRIQSAAASMTKLAAIYFYRWIKENSIDAQIVNLVHDEIVVECDKKIAKEVSEKLTGFMQKAGEVILQTNLVPMTASSVIADYWAH